MSRDQAQDSSPIEGLDQLLDYFAKGGKTRAGRGIGTEHEKFMFHRDSGRLLDFDGPDGIEALLQALGERFGWEPGLDRGRVVALERGDEAVTLEPGGQFELSGGVKRTVFETADEFDRHLREIAEVAGDRLSSTCWGMNPFDDLEALGWVPKSRYDIMRAYLPTRGDLAHWMMKTTCTIQANVDYLSEADAVEILRLGVLAGPLVTALFANSPLRAGADTGMQSFRAHVWTRTDPDRSGVPAFMYRDDWGFAEYVEYALDVPMFFIRRDPRYVDLSGQSFRDLMAGKIEGYMATMGDFELHLSTIFPEVRLKRFIEFRGADGGDRAAILAQPAIWKGLAYHEPARQAVRELMASYSEAEHRSLFDLAARRGVHGVAPDGRTMRDLSAELLRIAGDGLDALAAEFDHDSERGFLAPLQQIVDTGVSAADRLRADYDEVGGERLPLIERYELLAR